METSQVSSAPADVNNAPRVQDRIWLHPWSSSEIRKHASHWSLAGDAGILLALEMMSENLRRKASAMQQNIDETVQVLNSTQTRVENCLNDFLTLANSQFIENRVYDDEEEIVIEKSPVNEESEKTTLSSAEAQEKALQRYSEALQIGLNVLQTHFQQIDPKFSDDKHSIGDDDDEQSRIYNEPMLEPINFYDSRLLPALIGSQEFIEDEFIGLRPGKDPIEISERRSTISQASERSASDASDDLENSKKEEKPIVPIISPAGKPQTFPTSSPTDDTTDSDDNPFGTDNPPKEKPSIPVGPSLLPPPDPRDKRDKDSVKTDSDGFEDSDDGSNDYIFGDSKSTTSKTKGDQKKNKMSDDENESKTGSIPQPLPEPDFLSQLKKRVQEKAQKHKSDADGSNDDESWKPSVTEKLIESSNEKTSETKKKLTEGKPNDKRKKLPANQASSDDDSDGSNSFGTTNATRGKIPIPDIKKNIPDDEDSDDLFKPKGNTTTTQLHNTDRKRYATGIEDDSDDDNNFSIKYVKPVNPNKNPANPPTDKSTNPSASDPLRKTADGSKKTISSVSSEKSNLAKDKQTASNPSAILALPDDDSDDDIFKEKPKDGKSTVEQNIIKGSREKNDDSSNKTSSDLLLLSKKDKNSSGNLQQNSEVQETSDSVDHEEQLQPINPSALDVDEKPIVKLLAAGLKIPLGLPGVGGLVTAKRGTATENPVEKVQSNTDAGAFQRTTKKPSSFLTDDDDDDNDEKILSKNKKNVPLFTPKEITTKSLYNDSDDQDDLLLPSKKKPISATASSILQGAVPSATTSADLLDDLPALKSIGDKSMINMNKDRISVIARNRTSRPRTIRTSAAAKADDDDLFGTGNTNISPSTTSSLKSEPVRSTTVPSSSTRKIVIDGDEDEDELFGSTSSRVIKAQPTLNVASVIPKSTVKQEPYRHADDDDDGGDDHLFSEPTRKPNPTQSTPKTEPSKLTPSTDKKPSKMNTQDDPVISASPSSVANKSESTPPNKSSALDTDDGLFSVSATKTIFPQEDLSKKKKELIDDDDEIFGSTAPKTNASQASIKNQTATRKPVRSPTLDDDGDLFGTASSKTNTSKSSSSMNTGMSAKSAPGKSVTAATALNTSICTKEKKKSVLFDSDDSDIDALLFGSSMRKTPSTASKSESKTSKTTASIVDDDFLASKPKKKADLDSIFDESKPSKSKVKKDWSLLDGTGDDIFNSTSTSSKSAETTKSKSTSSRSTLKTDIDDIFDDPLNVSSKKK